MEIKEEVLKNEKIESRTAEEMTADFEEAVQEARNLPGGICGYIVLAIGRKHEDKKGRPATICVNGKTDDLAFLYDHVPNDIKKALAVSKLSDILAKVITTSDEKEEK